MTIPCCSSWTGGRKGAELSHRTGYWATHIFREHNIEADRWAGYGAKGREAGWVHDSFIDWSEVQGMCVFWHGSCNDDNCGAGIVIFLFTPKTGWIAIFFKNVDWCLVLINSLDACGVTKKLENVLKWIKNYYCLILLPCLTGTCCIA